MPSLTDRPDVPLSRLAWRSLRERARLGGGRTPELPDGAELLGGVDRRDFLKLVGASAALLGAG